MESSSAPAALALSRVTRSFGPVQILFDIDLELVAGEVHALIGENGAGKSTTMKILSGYLAASSGTILLDGRTVTFADSEAAENAGVVMIHQEFNLAGQLSVEENIFLGRELRRGPFLDKPAMREQARALLDQLECHVDVRTRLDAISVPDKQMVEIAKALSRQARVLIMDEPTAVLTSREAAVLFRQVERLKASGVALLFTSHKLDEVKGISDRVTVMRDGHVVAAAPTHSMTEDGMAEAMVGRELSGLFPAKGRADRDANEPPALSVRALQVPGFARDIAFELHRGEVLGIAGLIGSGRTEAMEGLVGLRPATAEVLVDGNPVTLSSLSRSRDAGIAYLTEDRKERGLFLNQGMRENLTLLALKRFDSGLLIDRKAEAASLEKAVNEFDIRAPHPDVLVGNLSGGNQQKLLIAKTMLAEPDVVIIDEPTRGIDIGTKQQIYEFIRALTRAGKAIIVVSSEMSEVIGLADRVLVMRGGRIAGVLEGEEIAERPIVRLAMGLSDEHNTDAFEEAS